MTDINDFETTLEFLNSIERTDFMKNFAVLARMLEYGKKYPDMLIAMKTAEEYLKGRSAAGVSWKKVYNMFVYSDMKERPASGFKSYLKDLIRSAKYRS